MMGKAPFCHDGSASTNDSRHSLSSEGDESEEDARVDGEVIDSLFGLFNEGVPKDFPCEIFGSAVDLLEGLVNRHSANWHWGVPKNPFAGGVNIFTGGEIHHRVCAPFRGPTHFFHFLFDARGDGAVADVGINFNEEVTANDHRLEFGVIDISGNDGVPCRDFVAHKLRRDDLGDALRKSFEDARRIIARGGTGVLVGEGVTGGIW